MDTIEVRLRVDQEIDTQISIGDLIQGIRGSNFKTKTMKYMDTIEVRLKIDQEIDTQISIGDLIQGINEQPMTYRWNAIGKLLNEINVTDDLEAKQKAVVVKYLKSKLAIVEKNSEE